MNIKKTKTKKFESLIAKPFCPWFGSKHRNGDIGMASEEILADGLLKKVGKDQNILEVAIGEGMEFTIHGDTKNKSKKNKYLVMNNSKVSYDFCFCDRKDVLIKNFMY